MLRSLSKCVSINVLRTAYFAVFHSHLSYATLAWGHSSGMTRLFRIQRKAVRIIAGLPFREDCRQQFSSLGILTLPCVFILECVLYVRRNEEIFRTHRDIHGHHTRFRDNLVPAYWRLKRCQDGPGYWAIKFFNILPQNFRSLPIMTFKKSERILNKKLILFI